LTESYKISSRKAKMGCCRDAGPVPIVHIKNISEGNFAINKKKGLTPGVISIFYNCKTVRFPDFRTTTFNIC
jgi:hypothetical protein